MYKDQNLFTKLRTSLVHTRKKLREGLLSLFSGVKKIDDSVLMELESKLLVSDIGIYTTKKIINRFVNRYNSMGGSEIRNDIYSLLCDEMINILCSVNHPLVISDKHPFIILIVGVNGVGKTSMIGKLSNLYRSEGKTVLLGAADTFRAAAVEQLKILGEQSDVSVVSSKDGSDDPASVVFESIRYAQSKFFDVLIIDTAGRLQNKSHLMDELKKIVRVIKKFDVDAPHEVMIVLDATIGQNSINQVALFKQCVGITGVSMSKLDGTSKGGVLFAIVDQFNVPIRYVSFGKGISDLGSFDVNDFVKSIFN